MTNRSPYIELLFRDQATRIHEVRKHHGLFFSFYFNHYITFESAPFHREILSITEDMSTRLSVILSFRGSGKSTLISLSYVLWAIMGVQQVKFVLIVGQSQEQARQTLRNIRSEIENNDPLHSDLGPFRHEDDEWRSSSLEFSKYNAKIMAVSVGQSVRGLRHGPHRPQLIICDDVEDMESVRTREGRQKTYNWIVGELLPAGTSQTRSILIGNLLHADALLPRFKRSIESGAIRGLYRAYPLIDKDGDCLWKARYPTKESLDLLFQAIGGDLVVWARELLLQLIDDGGRIVAPEWIRYYTEQPADSKLMDVLISIDLAISKSETADFTAMVAAKVFSVDGKKMIYIQPNPINQRLTHLETVETAKHLANALKGSRTPRILVEDVGYQSSLVEALKAAGYRAEGFKVRNQDKRSRLMLGSHLIQGGQVLFPKQGCEELIAQILDFGVELHDDLSDSLSMLLLSVPTQRGGFFGAVIDAGSDDDEDGDVIGGHRWVSLA